MGTETRGDSAENRAPIHRHVVLVEDDVFLGEMLVSALTGENRESIKVSWFVRARLEPLHAGGENLVFMDADGHEFFFSNGVIGDKTGLPLPTSRPVDLAFVDYRLKMSNLTGLEVTRKLTAGGVKVIACSGLPWLNDELIQAGAHCGMEKDKIFSRALKESDFLDQIYLL